MPNLPATTAPVRLLLNKDTVWTWGSAQATVFKSLKRMVASSSCVAHYNSEYPTTVSADASSYGLGAILLQEQASEVRLAVAFASRALTAAEEWYSWIKKEAIGVS